MQLTWNDRYRELIGGLDILGVRQLDQNLEARLVGGLTTVAPRARYMSLIPLALATAYRQLLAEGDDRLTWTAERQNEVLTRLEFLVVAATQQGAQEGEQGSTTGMIGSDVYAAQLRELAEQGSTELPEPRGSASLGAYGSPIQGFGLLTPAASGGPLALTSRGSDLVKDMELPTALQRLLLQGGRVDRATISSIRQAVSLNALRAAGAEWQGLLHALDEPASDEAAPRSDRFRATRAWLMARLAEEPSWGDGLMNRAYADLVAGRASADIALSWAEVALRKRVHFALELLLAALTTSLEPGGSTIDVVVARLSDDATRLTMPEVLLNTVTGEDLRFDLSWRAFQQEQPPDAFLAHPPHRRLARLQPVVWQLVAALALIATCERQSRSARQAGWIPDRAHAMEKVFALTSPSDGDIAEVAAGLLQHQVALRHLRHTLRKMADGQSNSLRFFPRGRRLVPTGTAALGGYSLTRLDAVLRQCADLGQLEPAEGGLRPTPAGLAWAREVQQ